MNTVTRDFRRDGRALEGGLALAAATPRIELPFPIPRHRSEVAFDTATSTLLDLKGLPNLDELLQVAESDISIVLLSAFAALLYRYSQVEEIPIAATGLQPSGSGCRGSELIVSCDLSAAPCFKQVIARIGKAVNGARRKEPSAADAFASAQFAFVFDEGENPVRDDHANVAKPLAAATDLQLHLRSAPDGLRATLHDNAGRLDAGTATRMLGHWRTLLEGAVRSPDVPVAKLPLLPESERGLLLDEWTQRRHGFPKDCCIHELFAAQVRRTPEAVALIFESESLTYSELHARVQRLAARLRARGVGPEIPVGVCLERSIELAVAVLATLTAGGAIVPLDPDWPADRLQMVVDETKPPAVLAQKKFRAALPQSCQTILCLDDGEDQDAGTAVSAQPVDAISATTADHLCVILFTSGSTGIPKGVLMPHRVCCRMLWAQANAIPLGPTDRRLVTSSIGFASFLGEICSPLFEGAAVVLARPHGYQDIDYLLEMIDKHRITVIGFVPSVLRLVLERIEKEGPKRCQSLRHIFSHGEALSPALQRLLTTHLRADLHKFYGLSEAPAATYWNCRNGEDPERTTIGRPTDMEVYLLDRHQQLVPIGVPGEIYVGGAGMARGYLGLPELTAERFIENPIRPDRAPRLFRTGDLGRWLPEGVIEFLGRVDEQVKVNGVRIDVHEVEAALAQHPDVHAAVVALQEPRPGWKRLAAWVEGNPGRTVGVNGLRRFVSERLPPAMVPAVFLVVQALPRMPNGKVDRRTVTTLVPQTHEPASKYDPPRTAEEKVLAAIWADVLDVPRVGVFDNFLELGGDSLRVFRLLCRIEAELGCRLPLGTLFRAPTIDQLAALLRQQQGIASKDGARVSTTRPPLFCMNYGLNLARYLGADQPVYELATEQEYVSKTSGFETLAAAYIERLRKIQPTGPYFLSGYAASGIVAYEMAQQLSSQGQKIAFLGIVDTYLFPHPYAFLVRRVLHHARTIVRTHPSRWTTYLRGRRKAVEVRLATRLPADDSTEEIPVWDLVARIQANYRPRRSTCPVTLFLPEDVPREQFREIRSSWSKVVPAPKLEVVTVPGGHYSLVEEPNVRTLAAEVQSRLRQSACEVSPEKREASIAPGAIR